MKSWIIIRLSTESHTNTANQLLTGALAWLRRIKVAMNVIMISPALSPLQEQLVGVWLGSAQPVG